MISTRRQQCGLWIGLVAIFPVLTACGGGSSSSPPAPPTNTAPISNAGAPQTVFEGVAVNLNGASSSDPDQGDVLTYTWTQVAGQTVAINNANSVMADFVAPDVQAGAPEVLTFQLEVNDGTVSSSNNNTNTVNITVEENEPPVASAGPDRSVIENTQVELDASASSDPNSIDVLSFSWNQVGGAPVGLTGDNTAQATFTAPDIAPGNTEILVFEVVVSDGVNDDTDAVTITVEDGQTMVAVSGSVNYEFVPPTVIPAFPHCRGLNFAATQVRPIRGATVQLIDAVSGQVLDATTSDETGGYSFTDVPALLDVRLRVRAELKQVGSPGWDVDVRDNVDTSGSPPPLSTRPLYVVEGSNFNTGGADVIQDYTARSGWDLTTNSYANPRSAAPFAILDAFYAAMQFTLSADPAISFPAIDAFWSVNNVGVQGAADIDNGELPAAFYSSNPDGGLPNPSLFLRGDSNTDTDEFDDHLVLHEWGHYFEDNFSRSDSTGGAHALGDSVDARLAFGEGWATAFAAMALDEPLYCDTGRPGTTDGFGIDAESDNFGLQGWYNEISVATLLYDLFDADNDGPDNDSIGFQPIFDTMVGPQASTEAFTSIFSFAAELRPMLNTAQQSFLDAQLSGENIDAMGIDIWGSMETNNANGNRDVLPLYTEMTGNGSITNICTNSDFDGTERTGNKLAQDRYIRLSVPVTDTYNVTVTTITLTPPTPDPDDRDQSDPDIYIYRDGALAAFGNSVVDNAEIFTTQNNLIAGEIYSAYVEEFRYNDSDPDTGTPDTYPDQVCFDISFTATP